MASGIHKQLKTVVGAASELTVYFDFVPKQLQIWVDGGATIEHGFKDDSMSGSAYLSTSTGTDAGVTINSDGSVTIANGADVNVATATIYVMAFE